MTSQGAMRRDICMHPRNRNRGREHTRVTRRSVLGTAPARIASQSPGSRAWTLAVPSPDTSPRRTEHDGRAARCAWRVWPASGAYIAWGGRGEGLQHSVQSPPTCMLSFLRSGRPLSAVRSLSAIVLVLVLVLVLDFDSRLPPPAQSTAHTASKHHTRSPSHVPLSPSLCPRRLPRPRRPRGPWRRRRRACPTA